MRSPEFLAIHIMKTAGTSLRRMLADGLGVKAVHPNDKQLRRHHRGWYPGPAELVEQVRSGAAGTPRLVIGHIPYVLVDEFERRPRTIALLRDPIARAVSMLEHRRTRTKGLAQATYLDLLADDRIVGQQIRDYQTKIFAYDSVQECPERVHQVLTIDDARFDRALERLEQVDVLGVVEEMPAFTRRLSAVTGITAGEERTANRGSYPRDALPDELRTKLEQLTERDAVLYRRARQIVAGQDAA